MTEGSNGGRYACRHSNAQFPRKRGNWAYMDIKDNWDHQGRYREP